MSSADGWSSTRARRTAGAVEPPIRPTRRGRNRVRASRLRFWRSPDDQPRWARPALLVVAALAALAYGWGMNGDVLETFYAGAVRSMSQNWHNFFFGAFDPWGTVSVDKLPGAFWVQALSVRVFGFHVWAFVLPQVVEGTLTVLVLYRAVRRVAGAGAGLVAAVALAVTPVTILLNRGNISDSLLDPPARPGRGRGHRRVHVGPPPPARPRRRLGRPGLPGQDAPGLARPPGALHRLPDGGAGAEPGPPLWPRRRVSAAVALAVSLSWMCIVALVPAHDRPYVDGSCNNSVFSQVFLYNGADRLNGKVLDQPGCTPTARRRTTATTVGGAPTVALDKGPARYLAGALGRDAAWLFIPAMVASVGILIARRRRPRTDPWRAAAVLWGVVDDPHLGLLRRLPLPERLLPGRAGAADGGALRARPRPRLADMRARTPHWSCPPSSAQRFSAGWPRRCPSSRAAPACGRGSSATTLVLTALAARAWRICLARTAADAAKWAARAALALGAAALLIGAAWASGTAVANGLGPFDSPYQSQR